MRISVFLFLFSSFLFQNVLALEGIWYYTETPRSRESFQTNVRKINIFAPQTYELLMDGEVKSTMKNDVVEYAHKYGVKIMPLIANTNGKVFNQKTIINLLDNKSAQAKLVGTLRSEAVARGFIGWQLDLENIPVSYKSKFNDFVIFTKKEFAKDNLILSAAIVSKISDNPKDYDKNYWNNWAGAYDYKALASSTDFLSIMAYDEPNSKGPVASIGWSKKVLNYSLRNVAPEKISFGIPVYGWAYRSEDLKKGKKHFTMIDYSFTYSKVSNLNRSDKNNMTTGGDRSVIFGNIPWVSYNQSGKNYTIWYEDQKSFATKLEQIKNAKVRGFSVWVLGDEDPQVWDLSF